LLLTAIKVGQIEKGGKKGGNYFDTQVYFYLTRFIILLVFQRFRQAMIQSNRRKMIKVQVPQSPLKSISKSIKSLQIVDFKAFLV
jgi:hypothetical protein